MEDPSYVVKLTEELQESMNFEKCCTENDLHNLSKADRALRKASVQNILTVLKNAPDESHYKTQIQNLLIKFCQDSFRAPKIETASPLLSADSKTSSKQLDVIESSVVSVCALLLSLKSLIPVIQDGFLTDLLDQLWTVLECEIPDLSIKSYDLFALAFSQQLRKVNSLSNVEVTLKRLILNLEKDQNHDWKLSVALMNAIHSIFIWFSAQEVPIGIELLPTVFPLLYSRLLAEQSEVRDKSQLILTNLMTTYISQDKQYLQPTNQIQHLECLKTLCNSVKSGLLEVSIESFQSTSRVIKLLFECLGHAHGYLASDLLLLLGEIHKSFESAEDLQTEAYSTPPLQVLVEKVIGHAISYLGSKTTLKSLPLQIKEVMNGQIRTEPRTWLLPLIKRYVYSDSLSYWVNEFLPLAEILREKKESLIQSDKELEFKYHVLQCQIWATLPSFCQMPLDVNEVYNILSETLKRTFRERSDLQDTIALAMSRLWSHAVDTANVTENSSEWSEYSVHDLAKKMNVDVKYFLCRKSVHEIFHSAHKSLEHFRKDALEWFQIMSQTFLQRKVLISQDLYGALTSLCGIFEKEVFKSVAQQLMIKLQEVFMDPAQVTEQGIHLDLVCVLVQSMSDNIIHDILRLIEMILKSNVSENCQKKAYKVLAYILETRQEAWACKAQEMYILLESTSLSCLQPSVYFRMTCIGTMLHNYVQNQNSSIKFNETVANFLPEIVLGFSADSTKVITKAHEIFKELAKHYVLAGNSQLLIKLLQPGLTSDDNGVILSTVKCLNCLINCYGIFCLEDLSDMVTKILELTKQTEKLTAAFSLAVVHFLQTLTNLYNPESLKVHLEAIMEFLLKCEIPMRKCQRETKELLSHLGEKLTFALLDEFVPTKYSRVMRNLRSLHNRQLRRNEDKSENDSDWINQSQKTFTSNYQTTTKNQSQFKGAESALPRVMNLSLKDREEQEEQVEEEEARDLLDPSESRKLAKAAAVAGPSEEMELGEKVLKDAEFRLPLNEQGKIIISERTLRQAERRVNNKMKRMRESGSESGLTLKTNKKSRMNESKNSQTSKHTNLKSHLSGKRFKARKGARGDAKGRSRYEPFAYWKFDRNLLNKRQGKRNAARRDLRKMTKKV